MGVYVADAEKDVDVSVTVAGSKSRGVELISTDRNAPTTWTQNGTLSVRYNFITPLSSLKK